jgi:thioredoxin 1
MISLINPSIRNQNHMAINKILLQIIFPVIFLLPSLEANSGSPQKIIENVYQLTDQDFDQFTARGIVLVDFWAVWCGPCRLQSPIIDEIAQEIGQKAIIAKVNVDEAKITSTRYRIQYIPTIIIFRDGNPVARFTGVQDKETLITAINNQQ